MSHITALFLSHTSPYCLWVSYHTTVFWVTCLPYFCELVSPSCLWVTCRPPPTVCESYVILFLWGTFIPLFESCVALLFMRHMTPYFSVSLSCLWVTCHPIHCLWIMCNPIFVSNVSPYCLWVAYRPTVCKSRVALLFCGSHITLLFVSHVSSHWFTHSPPQQMKQCLWWVWGICRMFEKGMIRRLLELTSVAVTWERESDRCVMISFTVCSVTVFMLTFRRLTSTIVDVPHR